MKNILYPSLLALSMTLSACGGGGGGTTDGTSTLPDQNSANTATTNGSATTLPGDATASTPATAPAGSTSGSAPAASTPGSTTTAQSYSYTIDQAIADMSSPSEALVIDPRYDWQYKAGIIMYAPRGDAIPSWWTGNRPTWTYSALTWFTAFEAQGNSATNTRIQIKNLRFYVLSESTRTWKQYDFKAAPGVDLWQYPFTVASGSSGVRSESTGGISIKPKYPNFHHGYGNGVTINPQDVRATFVAMDFRLAVDDTSKPDDRANAKYVVNTGGDYWPGNGQGDWSLGYAPGMGSGRMLSVTKDWRTASMLVPNSNYGSDFNDLRNNPPPMN